MFALFHFESRERVKYSLMSSYAEQKHPPNEITEANLGKYSLNAFLGIH